MPSKTFDEVRELLAQKIAVEKKRLKTYGTKTNSFDMANAISAFVLALMADSRARELRRLEQWVLKEIGEKTGSPKLDRVMKQLRERKRATKAQAQAIKNLAESKEKARPWKRG